MNWRAHIGRKSLCRPSAFLNFSITVYLRFTTCTSSSQNLFGYYRNNAALNESAPNQFLLKQLLKVMALFLILPFMFNFILLLMQVKCVSLACISAAFWQPQAKCA